MPSLARSRQQLSPFPLVLRILSLLVPLGLTHQPRTHQRLLFGPAHLARNRLQNPLVQSSVVRNPADLIHLSSSRPLIMAAVIHPGANRLLILPGLMWLWSPAGRTLERLPFSHRLRSLPTTRTGL